MMQICLLTFSLSCQNCTVLKAASLLQHGFWQRRSEWWRLSPDIPPGTQLLVAALPFCKYCRLPWWHPGDRLL